MRLDAVVSLEQPQNREPLQYMYTSWMLSGRGRGGRMPTEEDGPVMSARPGRAPTGSSPPGTPASPWRRGRDRQDDAPRSSASCTFWAPVSGSPASRHHVHMQGCRRAGVPTRAPSLRGGARPPRVGRGRTGRTPRGRSRDDGPRSAGDPGRIPRSEASVPPGLRLGDEIGEDACARSPGSGSSRGRRRRRRGSSASSGGRSG